MNRAARYEFFAGHSTAGTAIWTTNLALTKPIAAWRDRFGCVTLTYNAPLKKFLLCVTDGGNTLGRFHTSLLESDRLTGPWKLVAFLENFGEQAYFVNIPSKFISADGRTLWLCYSANFSSGWGGVTFRSRPPDSRYAMCLQEVKLLAPADPTTPDALNGPDNVALEARVSVSSTFPGHSAGGVNDGIVDGYPRDPGNWDNGDLSQRATSLLNGLVDYYRYTGDAAASAR